MPLRPSAKETLRDINRAYRVARYACRSESLTDTPAVLLVRLKAERGRIDSILSNISNFEHELRKAQNLEHTLADQYEEALARDLQRSTRLEGFDDAKK